MSLNAVPARSDCSVCLDQLSYPARLACGHVYDRPCIEQCVPLRCPMDRRNFTAGSIEDCPELQEAVYPIIRETLTFDKMLEIWSKNWVLATKIASLPQSSSAQKVQNVADWALRLWKDGQDHYQEIYKKREKQIGSVEYKKRFESPLKGPLLHQVMVAAEKRADHDLEVLWMGSPFSASPDDLLYYRLEAKLENYPNRYPGIQLPPHSEWTQQKSSWLANPLNRPLLRDSRNPILQFVGLPFPAPIGFPLYLQLQMELASYPNDYQGIELPSFSAPAATLRTWLNNPFNRPLLECVKHLNYLNPFPRNKVFTVLPREISLFPNLTSLVIVESGIEILPASLESLRKLKILVLRDGNLAELPDSICKIQSLEHLNLQFNKISKISERLGNLTHLRSLSLWNNQISELPDSVGDLTQLEKLDMAKNQLTRLPPSFDRIKRNLRCVNFTWNARGFELPADLKDKQTDGLDQILSACTIQ